MREPRPVNRVEISEQNKTLRLIAAIALLVIGALGITVGVMNALRKDTGWQGVQISTQERSCHESFLLQYNFGQSGVEATAVNQKLQTVYAEACVKAYQMFTPDEEISGVNNLYHINRHPNEVITVDPALYAAFEKMDGTPYLTMGPVYDYYYSVIYNAPEDVVPQMDPVTDGETAAYIGDLMAYGTDETAVRMELLGSNQIRLFVSDDYLQFAQEEEIENFIDFAYLTNAFIIDYLADVLVENGLTDGFLTSVDGYTRNLCDGVEFCFNIFDKEENLVYPAGVMEYQAPISIAYLKDYPTANDDTNYRQNDDHFVHLFADPADGIYRLAKEELVSYSYEGGCADVALKMLPGFVGKDFSVPSGVYSIWCEDGNIYYNDEAVTIGQLLKDANVDYRAALKD